MEDIEKYAKKIWNYLRIDNELQRADAIVMFGSHDPLVAEYASQLYLDNWAPIIVFSGARGQSTADWEKTEADTYADIARKMDVPEKDLLVENKSTNTAENIKFTKKLLEDNKVHPKRIIIVQKPYMGRRVLVTMEKMWNDIDFLITSPQIPFEKYKVPELTREEMIGSVVGDIKRLKLYAEKGFTTKQEIPEDVWEARNKIRKAGITRRYIDV